MNNSNGAALVTVLFITVLASTIVVSLVTRQQIDFRRTSNIIESNRAYLLAQGVIEWGAIVLARDRDENSFDNLSEDWAYGLKPTQIKGGTVAGEIEDMQGRFNINNLVSNDPDFRDHCRAQFARMLDMCGLETDLVNAVIDWLDDDFKVSLPGGAEDESYMAGPTPYAAANSIMLNPSELKLVAGFNSQGFMCLAPHISALPEDTYINVNTTSAFVLASVSDNFSLEDGEDFIESRTDAGFNSVSSFFQDPIIEETEFFGPFMTVSSNYFLANVKSEVTHGSINLFSLLYRDGDGARVVLSGVGSY